MSQTTKEIPVWVGGESGQRRRYLRASKKFLAAAFGPQWCEKLASNNAVSRRVRPISEMTPSLGL